LLYSKIKIQNLKTSNVCIFIFCFKLIFSWKILILAGRRVVQELSGMPR
jgi:hypothetical protein